MRKKRRLRPKLPLNLKPRKSSYKRIQNHLNLQSMLMMTRMKQRMEVVKKIRTPPQRTIRPRLHKKSLLILTTMKKR